MSVIEYKPLPGVPRTSEERIMKRISELSESVKVNNALMAELMEKLDQMNGGAKARQE